MIDFFNKISKKPIDYKDIFVIWGQSNGQGYQNGLGAPNEEYLLGNIQGKIWNGSTFVNLNYPDSNQNYLNSYPNDHGCELMLAYEYNRRTSKLAYIVKGSLGNTSIRREIEQNDYDWDPDYNDEYSLLYTGITNINNALAEIESEGLKPRLRAIIWLQGEADISYTGYGNDLKRLIAQCRVLINNFNALSFDFIIFRISDYCNYGGNVNTIQAQQDALENKYVKVINTNELTFIPGLSGNGVHYNSDSQNQIALYVLNNLLIG